MLNRTGAVLAGAILLVCWSASSARAVTIQTTDSGHPWQQWADRAQVPTWQGALPFVVVNSQVDCGGMQANGCTSAVPQVDQTTGQTMPGGTPLASVSTSVDSAPEGVDARAVLYHELGQVFWQEYLTDADKAAFMSIVGLAPDVNEWNNWLYGSIVYEGQTRHFPPFEWFAEGYRYCATYGVNQPLGVNDAEGLFYPGDRPAFAPRQRQVCQLIDRIGERNGIPTPTQATYLTRPSKSTRATKATEPERQRGRRIVLTWDRRKIW